MHFDVTNIDFYSEPRDMEPTRTHDHVTEANLYLVKHEDKAVEPRHGNSAAVVGARRNNALLEYTVTMFWTRDFGRGPYIRC